MLKKTLTFAKIMTLLFTPVALAQTFSIHTGVDIEKDCVIVEASSLEKEPEIDYLNAECPGLGGYRVIVQGGDLRYGISLEYNGTLVDLDLIGAFHDLGSTKVEWVVNRRKTIEGSEVNYLAFIHRINWSDLQEDGTSKERTTLFVTKLAGANSCVVAKVEASDDMNKRATELGKKAQELPCLKD